MSRRRPRLAECRNPDDFVRGGFVIPFGPTAETGPIIYGAGRWLGPASTNLVRDPQCVNTLGTYWAAAPTDCTITPNTAVPVDFGGPAKCAKVEFAYDATARAWESEAMAATAGQAYTLQALIYVPALAASGSIAIAAVVMNGASEVRTVALGTVSAQNTTAVRYANSVTIAGSGETHIKYRYTVDGASSTFYVSGHKNANLAYLDPYHDGTMGGGFAWTGTAHQSTSTRAATVLKYTIPTAGWTVTGGDSLLAGRIYAMWAGNDSLNHYLATMYDASNNRCHEILKGSANAWNCSDATQSASASAAAVAANSYNTVIGRRSGDASLDVRANGTDGVQGVTLAAKASPVTLQIGELTTLGRTALGYVSCVVAGGTRPADTDPIMSMHSFADDVEAIIKAAPVGSAIIPLLSDSRAFYKVRG